jgi:hypothetical protein
MSNEIKDVDLHQQVIDITLDFFEPGEQCIEHSVPGIDEQLIREEEQFAD